MPRHTHINAPLVPNRELSEAARTVLQQLDPQPESARFALQDRKTGAVIELDETILRLLHEMVRTIANQQTLLISTVGSELTPNEAARILNVSRKFVSNLIQAGELPARKVGSHNRLRVEDVLAYKARDDLRREQAMQELTDMSQDMGLYD